METKKDILVRTYLVFLGLAIFGLAILGKLLYIQLAEGSYWIAMADNTRLRMEEIESERGTIYSEDGNVLSTSVPEFDIYVDYQAEGLREKNGKLFKENIDSLAAGLAGLFGDRTAAQYRKVLQQGWQKGERFSLLKRKISFADYQELRKLPVVREGRYKSGFIAEVRMKRLYPFRNLANRTVGIARDSNKVGLERQYDSVLSGITGRRLVRYIAGGAAMPVEGVHVEPQDGLDMVTTIDVGIQDAAHQALEKMMVENEAIHGTCIVMEVRTGKIRAIANLGRQKDGSYIEDYNYALAASEPGSTWKLVTLMSALEDKKVTPESKINLEGGRWQVASQVVFDSEIHGMHEATVQQAFEKSSNVGMAKLAYHHFGRQPSRYFHYLHKWRMDTLTGIDLPGEAMPRLIRPGNKWWNQATLPWMGFGYSLAITPMHTAMLYNAVANNGRMMKPYLVNALLKDGQVVQTFEPQVLVDQICSPETLAQVKQCLEGVVLRGTARRLQTDAFGIAGKTGTSLVADKGITYADKMYQASFAGYFPADNPQYTIVVVIRNRKHAPRYYGGLVAGPVFRDVADVLYGSHVRQPLRWQSGDTARQQHLYAGMTQTLREVARNIGLRYNDSAASMPLARLQPRAQHPVLSGSVVRERQMPSIEGFGLKDALEICEANGLQVKVSGKGRVMAQSIPPGSPIQAGQKITIQLN